MKRKMKPPGERVLAQPNTRGPGVVGYKVGKRTLWVPGGKAKAPPPEPPE